MSFMEVSIPETAMSIKDEDILINLWIVSITSPEYNIEGYLTDKEKLVNLSKENVRKAAIYAGGQFNIIYVASIGESIRKIGDDISSKFQPMIVNIRSYFYQPK